MNSKRYLGILVVSVCYLFVIDLSEGRGSVLPLNSQPQGSIWYVHIPVIMNAYSFDRIAYTRISDQGEIYLINPDGSYRFNLTNNPWGDGFGAWSPDGNQYSYMSLHPITYDSEIMVINADGTGMINLSNHPAANDIAPHWSPDGSKIVFTSDRDGDENIYVVNVDGTDLTRLTTDIANDHSAFWSPLGDKLVFVSDRDGNAEIYNMNPDGSQPMRLTKNNGIDELHPPAPWSPDGARIAYASWIPGEYASDLILMDADGSNQMQLTNLPGVEGFAAWSPDGTTIAFNSSPNNFTTHIYIIHPDGSGLNQLTFHPDLNLHPAWSPGGRRIAFTSDRDGNYELYVMNADGSVQINISNDPQTYDFDPTWRPR